ncbi:ribosomal protein S18-alanine N-acetyltransferase [Orenia marismortui]|uniref:[Ribosomal protein bS18]-alanine N-acetyltransferase n=1 Tax=Orenia marismortui TaxID=46469 RepID=A0A4R8GXL0_9FIRM|nr:ribosomal protein S18-alanine N-acetyltransferase [Orenia marismortui]TDX50957.1 ribosomal-protein-alanine N-acetyltransferase [Orenia marismortui]
MENLLIRPMKKRDLDQVLKIEEEVFSGSSWSKKAFINELKNKYSYYLVVTIADNIIGYIGGWLIFDEAHITTLAVSKEFRRQGIATGILEEFFEDIRNDNILKATLEVRVSNQGARKLYLKEGFVELGIRKNYYSDNQEDAIIMWKEL